MAEDKAEYQMDSENVQEAFNAICSKAEKILESPDKVEKLLNRLEEKLKGLPIFGDNLAYLPQMGLLVKYYIEKKYTEIPIGTIVALVGAILYFVLPADLLPDVIPGIGLLDDAAVVGIALLIAKKDIDEFMAWYDRNK